jgi:hypothetical protein
LCSVLKNRKCDGKTHRSSALKAKFLLLVILPRNGQLRVGPDPRCVPLVVSLPFLQGLKQLGTDNKLLRMFTH